MNNPLLGDSRMAIAMFFNSTFSLKKLNFVYEFWWIMMLIIKTKQCEQSIAWWQLHLNGYNRQLIKNWWLNFHDESLIVVYEYWWIITLDKKTKQCEQSIAWWQLHGNGYVFYSSKVVGSIFVMKVDYCLWILINYDIGPKTNTVWMIHCLVTTDSQW